MPSGRTVSAIASDKKVRINFFLNVIICVHSDDMDNSAGLCANYNNEKPDDLIPNHSTEPNIKKNKQPTKFTDSYM